MEIYDVDQMVAQNILTYLVQLNWKYFTAAYAPLF